jgi:hypothetical protein
MSLIDLDNMQRLINSFYNKIKKEFAAKSHGTHLTLGVGSGNAFRGDYGNAAYKHSQSAHAPSNAQKNSDITKAEIEAKLTGTITSHTHNYAVTSHASTATTYGVSSSSNYGHAMASGTTPKANGTASVGSETAKFARGDHVHPLQTTVSGNAGTATTLQTARTINGTSFNGSGNITTANWGTARNITIGKTAKSVNGSGNVSWSLSEIGAFSSGGGDLGGNLHLTPDNAGITGVCGGGTDKWSIIGGGTNDNGYLEINTKDNGNEPIYVRQYNANGLVRTAALLDNNGATSFPGLISEGGTKLTDKYAAKSHGHNEIWVKNAPFNSTNDTTANWGSQGVSVSWYPDGATITNKPNSWGFIFNIGYGSEVHQMWFSQSTGTTYHRGGNNGGWAGSWRAFLDSENFSSYAAPASHSHSNYLSTGGGALSGPIDVNGECTFHNGTYSDPWNGTGCAIKATGNIAATGIIKANGRMDIQGIPLSIQSSAPGCGGVWIQV